MISEENKEKENKICSKKKKCIGAYCEKSAQPRKQSQGCFLLLFFSFFSYRRDTPHLINGKQKKKSNHLRKKKMKHRNYKKNVNDKQIC